MFVMGALLRGLHSRRHCRVHTFHTFSEPSKEMDTNELLSADITSPVMALL